MPEAAAAIRRADPAEWSLIARLHALSWRTAYRGIYADAFLDHDAVEERRAYWREHLPLVDGIRDVVLLAERDGAALGFACLRLAHDEWGPLLDNLHVRPSCKGGGIGRLLIRAGAAWLVERDPGAPLQLLVWEANEPARGFYRRLGAGEVQRFDEATPGGGTAPIIRMRWPSARTLIEGGSLPGR